MRPSPGSSFSVCRLLLSVPGETSGAAPQSCGVGWWAVWWSALERLG